MSVLRDHDELKSPRVARKREVQGPGTSKDTFKRNIQSKPDKEINKLVDPLVVNRFMCLRLSFSHSALVHQISFSSLVVSVIKAALQPGGKIY